MTEYELIGDERAATKADLDTAVAGLRFRC